ncbi:UNVERIFIED_CONTAM: hypothetical protein FKN15_061756 [Acipenser sinensis]
MAASGSTFPTPGCMQGALQPPAWTPHVLGGSVEVSPPPPDQKYALVKSAHLGALICQHQGPSPGTARAVCKPQSYQPGSGPGLALGTRRLGSRELITVCNSDTSGSGRGDAWIITSRGKSAMPSFSAPSKEASRAAYFSTLGTEAGCSQEVHTSSRKLGNLVKVCTGLLCEEPTCECVQAKQKKKVNGLAVLHHVGQFVR